MELCPFQSFLIILTGFLEINYKIFLFSGLTAALGAYYAHFHGLKALETFGNIVKDQSSHLV